MGNVKLEVKSKIVYLQYVGSGDVSQSADIQKRITELYLLGYRLFSHESHIVPDGRILNIFVLELQETD